MFRRIFFPPLPGQIPVVVCVEDVEEDEDEIRAGSQLGRQEGDGQGGRGGPGDEEEEAVQNPRKEMSCKNGKSARREGSMMEVENPRERFSGKIVASVGRGRWNSHTTYPSPLLLPIL